MIQQFTQWVIKIDNGTLLVFILVFLMKMFKIQYNPQKFCNCQCSQNVLTLITSNQGIGIKGKDELWSVAKARLFMGCTVTISADCSAEDNRNPQQLRILTVQVHKVSVVLCRRQQKYNGNWIRRLHQTMQCPRLVVKVPYKLFEPKVLLLPLLCFFGRH